MSTTYDIKRSEELGTSPEGIEYRRQHLPPAMFLFGDSITSRGARTDNLCQADKVEQDVSTVERDDAVYEANARERQADAAKHAGFGHVVQLKKEYRGKMVVLEWGYGGWSTEMMVAHLDEIIPSRHEARIDIAVIEFGANCSSTWVDPSVHGEDSLPDQTTRPSRQAANLVTIVDYIREHHDDPRIAIMTVPTNNPVQMAQEQSKWFLKRHNKEVSPGKIPVNRSPEQARIFSAFARKAADDAGVPVIDLYKGFEAAGGIFTTERVQNDDGSWEVKKVRNTQFYDDGLHLTNRGYQVFYNILVDTVRKEWPDRVPERLPEWPGIAEFEKEKPQVANTWQEVAISRHLEIYNGARPVDVYEGDDAVYYEKFRAVDRVNGGEVPDPHWVPQAARPYL